MSITLSLGEQLRRGGDPWFFRLLQQAGITTREGAALLHHVRGATPHDTAAILGITPKAAKARVAKAQAKLREMGALLVERTGETHETLMARLRRDWRTILDCMEQRDLLPGHGLRDMVLQEDGTPALRPVREVTADDLAEDSYAQLTGRPRDPWARFRPPQGEETLAQAEADRQRAGVWA